MHLLLVIFLFLKTGEKFATQDVAGPTVAELTSALGKQLSEPVEPRVLNDPGKAVELCAKDKPAVGIVTPGFFLTYQKALGMEPLLEVHRAGIVAERFLLVAKKDASEKLADWTGKTIATTLAAEERYVKGVVLADKLGNELRVVPTGSVEDAVFDLVEGAKTAADGVLVEEAAWKVFAEDPELGPQLKVIYKSDELPRDLVVKFHTLDAEKVKAALLALSGDEAGQKILGSIRVEKFEPVNAPRLEQATKLFHGQ